MTMALVDRHGAPLSGELIIPDEQKAARTGLSKMPTTASAIVATFDGRVPVSNAYQYRYWAKYSEWIRGAFYIRRSQISSAEWDIVPYDQRKPYSKRLQQRIKRLFTRPNPSNPSYRSFIEPVTNDLLVLDAGVIEKVRNAYGELMELWPVDAATIRIDARWDGDQGRNRYWWYVDGQPRAGFTNDDMVYMMCHPRTEWPVGLPMLETLKLTIEAELGAHEYNRRQVEGAAPDGLLDLGEGIGQDQIDAFSAYFANEVAGQGTIGFIGGGKGAQFIDFHKSNREMQFLEWNIYLVRKICVVTGLTPQDLGVTFDINRSTAETQIQISEDRGLRPLMSVIQEYLTQEIVWDDAFEGPDNNLAFRFTALNLKESTARAQINQVALARVPWRTVNEARVGEGREPFPELEGKLIMATPQGALDISDVPTVREFMEMQNARKEPTPAPTKGVEEAVETLRLSTEEQFSQLIAQLSVLATMREAEPPAPPPRDDRALTALAEAARRPVHVEVHAPTLQAPEPVIEEEPVEEAVEELIAEVLPPEPRRTKQTIERDADGRIVSVFDDRVKKTVERDANGRIISVIEEELL